MYLMVVQFHTVTTESNYLQLKELPILADVKWDMVAVEDMIIGKVHGKSDLSAINIQ